MIVEDDSFFERISMLWPIILVSLEYAKNDQDQFLKRFWWIAILPLVICIGYALWAHAAIWILWCILFYVPWLYISAFLTCFFAMLFRSWN